MESKQIDNNSEIKTPSSIGKTNNDENGLFTNFLKELAQRKSTENDLSDVIYAACQASNMFKTTFVKFFFNEIEDASEIVLEREYTQKNCRVDFLFDYNEERYIIENKIYDTKQHFGTYDKVYGVTPSHFGYIMNYDVFEGKSDYVKQGYQIHTWKEFHDNIKNAPDKDDIFTPIAKYIKEVCSIIEIKTPMNITALNTLPIFLELLKGVFCIETDRYISEYYKGNGKQETQWGGNVLVSHDNCVVGRYFETKFKSVRGKYNTTWGWLGIYFNDPEAEPTICLGIRSDKNWAGKAYELITKSFSESSDWYEDGGPVWRDLSDEDYRKLEKSESIEEQKTILQSFFKSSMDYIADLIDEEQTR